MYKPLGVAWEREEGSPPSPPPIAMPAMINLWPKRLSFHLFLGLCLPCTRPWRRYRFFALHLFFEKNSVLQAVKLVLVVFFFGLHYISCGVVSYPNPKLVSNKISPPPPIKTLKSDCEDFFLGVHVCDLWFGPPPIKNPCYAYDKRWEWYFKIGLFNPS